MLIRELGHVNLRLSFGSENKFATLRNKHVRSRSSADLPLLLSCGFVQTVPEVYQQTFAKMG
jgi:hypothetical protein